MPRVKRFSENWFTPGGRYSGWFWLATLLLAGAGARLWLIHAFGTPLPFWDQWEESRVVFVPYLEGKLSLADLFSPHNENRIVFTRLYALGLLLVNGQFDNQVEMVANVVLYTVTLAGFGWFLARLMGRQLWPVIVLPLLLALMLPFAWENTLAGFHSQFYFMVLFSLLTIWLLGFRRPGSILWFLGVAAAFCSVFTMAAGLLAAAAVCGLAIMRILRVPSAWKGCWPTIVASLLVVACGLTVKIEIPYHRALMPHSLGGLLIALGKFLAWPWIVLPPYAIFNLFPLLLLAWVYLRHRETAVSMTAEEVMLTVGGWAVLQAAAGAYARGGQPYPQWRYMDSLCFLMIANALSLALVASRHMPKLKFLLPSFDQARGASPSEPSFSSSSCSVPSSSTPLLGGAGGGSHNFRGALTNSTPPLTPPRRETSYFKLAAGLWVLACLSGLVLLCWRAWTVDIPLRATFQRLQGFTTRAYLATGDRFYLQTREKEYLSRFAGPDAPDRDHAKALISVIEAPHVRSILPACARDPLPMGPQKVSGFVTNSAALIRPAMPGEVIWCSYAAAGAAATGQFESANIPKSKFPYLEFLVAGDLGQRGLSLAVVDARTGKETAVETGHAPGPRWERCVVKAPPGDFKIIARDESSHGWLAFQAPREMGRLSFWAGSLAAAGRYLCFAGLILLLPGLVMALRARSIGSAHGQSAEKGKKS